MCCLHILALHTHGSNNPLGITGNIDRIPMHPYYLFKDTVTIFLFLFVYLFLIFYSPELLGDPENNIPGNPLVTPTAIVPEFYLLPYYAILRSISSKIVGVIAMLLAILRRIKQFNTVMYIFEKELTLMKDIPLNIDIKYKTDLDYIKLDYFKNWIVGFVIAEGSFFCKKKGCCCFSLKQKNNLNLMIAIKSFFSNTTKMHIENSIYNYFVVSSKKDIQKVINFFSFEGNTPLLGLKLIQYHTWLNTLKNSFRYNELNFPK